MHEVYAPITLTGGDSFDNGLRVDFRLNDVHHVSWF